MNESVVMKQGKLHQHEADVLDHLRVPREMLSFVASQLPAQSKEDYAKFKISSTLVSLG